MFICIIYNHTVKFRPCAFLFQLEGMHTDGKFLALHCIQAIPKAVYAESYTLGIQVLDLMKTHIKHI